MGLIDELIYELERKSATTLGVTQGVRKIRKGAYGKRIIFFNSRKNGGFLMPCESELEYKYCLKLEFDNEVDAYFLQPFTLNVSETRSYTPDVLVRFVSNDYKIVEVKPTGSLERKAVKQTLQVAEEFITGEDYSYSVITEIDLQPEIEHVNREILYRASPITVSYSTATHARAILGDDFEGSLPTARKCLIKEGFDNNIIESLIFSGYATYITTSEFDDSAVIRLCDNE